jgi:Zn-dependent protease
VTPWKWIESGAEYSTRQDCGNPDRDELEHLGHIRPHTWELSDLILPNSHPHDASAIYWTIGTVTSLLFFASLLAHEVSHAVVAQRNGIAVRRITFWLFGGVSE